MRAGMVSGPADYPWSSYQHHIGMRTDTLVRDHPLYWALGNTPFEREAAYRSLAEQALTREELDKMRKSAGKGWAIGSEEFKSQLEKQTARRVSPGKAGRPYKKEATSKPDS